jgi:hypothetical protein
LVTFNHPNPIFPNSKKSQPKFLYTWT